MSKYIRDLGWALGWKLPLLVCLIGFFSVSSSGCESDKSGIGVTAGRESPLAILVKTCSASAVVYEVRLEEYGSDSKGRVVWDIVSSKGSGARTFEAGVTPDDFDERTPLDASQLSRDLTAVVRTSEVDHDGVSFDLGKVSGGTVLLANGKTASPDEFAKFNVCD